MREILVHTLGAGIVVKVEMEPGLPPMFADRQQLETVLINLANNASDAMHGAGVLTLAAAMETVRHGEPAARRVQLDPGAYLRLSVSDSGMGMTPELLARVTEPFFTTKEAGKGTGLGLPMARGFARQSGGELHIDSAPGEGATVTLWLPVANGASAERAGPAGATGAGSGEKGARVLLVDDDEIVRATLRQQLEEEGYDVLPASTGAEALSLLDAGEAVDLFVADLSMPGLDGRQFIDEATRRRPQAPAILLTGFAGSAEIAVANAVLRKPIEGRLLAERIEQLLSQGRAQRETAAP